MSVIWIRSSDGTSLFPADEIVSLHLSDGVLQAEVASLGIVPLAEGPEAELVDAARAFLPGLRSLGEGAFTVTAVRHPAGGIGWEAVAEDESGGGSWGAASSSPPGKR